MCVSTQQKTTHIKVISKTKHLSKIQMAYVIVCHYTAHRPIKVSTENLKALDYANIWRRSMSLCATILHILKSTLKKKHCVNCRHMAYVIGCHFTAYIKAIIETKHYRKMQMA